MAAALFLMPNVNYGQAPVLGTAANFVLFTTSGAVTNSGIAHLTHLTGNVGSNLAGSVTGFGNVDGVMHVFDGATGTAVTDLLSLYSQLNIATPTATLGTTLGSGDTLTAGVYYIPAAATLNLNLVLNGLGNPNALFIFQINGPLATSTLSNVKLINGALACNVFWKVEGAVTMAAGSTMRGTIVAHNALINMGIGDSLEGRALSINGAISTNAIVAFTPIGCGSGLLTGPAAPAILDSTAVYSVFSSIGPVTSTPVTYVNGSVGSNTALPTGFIPSNVSGSIQGMDVSTANAAADLTNIYNYLNTLPADIDLMDPANFGYNLVLTPHTYLLTPATMLTDTVILNAEGDANAVFIFRINGSFLTSTSSDIKLINGAQAKNVYWLINGAVHIYDNSIFNGTMVVAGAITLNTLDTFNGRALTINGAVAVNGSYMNAVPLTAGCTAPAIAGVMSVCQGDTTTLSDSTTGGIWSSSNTALTTIDSTTGLVTGVAPGMDTVTYTTTAGCTSTTDFTVNPAPSAITGADSVCTGFSTTMIDTTTGGSWSSSNALLATVGTGSGMVTGVAAGTPVITYTLPTGCVATKVITVNATTGAGIITGPSSVCVGSTITLTDTTAGGVWSSSNNARATVGAISGIVTGVSGGIDTIRYIVITTCGIDTATKIITVNTATSAGIITGASGVCVGDSTMFADVLAPGGTWSSSNANAAVGTAGMVTGVTAGIDTIIYTITGGCGGGASATKAITVNPIPSPGTITGPSGVCAGSSITLTESVFGGGWSSSNIAIATVTPTGFVTGITAGTDTIRYLVFGLGCPATATKTITVNPIPDPGVITGASTVCVGSSITLTDPADGGVGGVWSSSNSNASLSTTTGAVTGVTGVTAGTDVISYTVTTSGCSSPSATKTITINPLPDAGTISGISNVCVGSTTSPFTDGAAGGLWSSSNPVIAGIIGSAVTGITPGVDTIIYTVTTSCGSASAIMPITVNPLPDAGTISGALSVCVGVSTSFTDGVPGGTWSRSNTNANVGPTTGIVTGVTAGTDMISYTVTTATCGSNSATKNIIVNPLANPGTITGASNVCVGSPITLTDAAFGGTWSSSNANATAGTTGIVTGVTAGPDTISYAVTNGCGTVATSKAITVNPLPDAGTITGLSGVCVNATITLSDGAAGGVWSSSNAMATAGTGGAVTGITVGTDTITYRVVTATCGSASTSKTVTVNPLPEAGAIMGAAAVCVNSPIVLVDLAPGGVWSSSNAMATVGTSGIVTGVTAGTVIVSYTVTTATCGSASATKSIAVDVLPLVPVITTQAPSTACLGTMYQNFGIATPAPASTTYKWTATNAIVWAQGAGHQYALVNFTEAGTAYVTLNATMSGTGCVSQSTVTVTVSTSDAQVSVVAYFNDHFVCTPANESSYQWGYDDAYTLDSSILTGEVNQDYINANPDFSNKDYWVMTTSGGCLQKTYYSVPTTVQNINSGDAGISVYPNPASSFINVTVSSSIKGNVQLEVLNMMGQKVNNVPATDNKAVIDIASLPAGSYLVTCYSDGIKIASARFIKD